MGFLYKKRTIEEQAQSLAAYLPEDRTFCGKDLPGFVLNDFIRGLAVEIFRVENLINEISNQHDINQTTDFIEEWERALGIPDDCFKQTSALTIKERRRQVLTKLTTLSVSTVEDFVRLANVLVPGVKIKIVQVGSQVVFPLDFPCQFSSDAKTARFTMVVELSKELAPEVFPFVNFFPIPFSSNSGNIIECIFNKVKPANVRVVFKYIL